MFADRVRCLYAYSEGLPWFVRLHLRAHTVSVGEKDQSEGPLLVLCSGWSAFMWKHWDELSHVGELITRRTNKRKCGDREKSPNSPRA